MASSQSALPRAEVQVHLAVRTVPPHIQRSGALQHHRRQRLRSGLAPPSMARFQTKTQRFRRNRTGAATGQNQSPAELYLVIARPGENDQFI